MVIFFNGIREKTGRSVRIMGGGFSSVSQIACKVVAFLSQWGAWVYCSMVGWKCFKREDKARCAGSSFSGSPWKSRWQPVMWGRPVKLLRRSWAVSILDLSFRPYLSFLSSRFSSSWAKSEGLPGGLSHCQELSQDVFFWIQYIPEKNLLK